MDPKIQDTCNVIGRIRGWELPDDWAYPVFEEDCERAFGDGGIKCDHVQKIPIGLFPVIDYQEIVSKFGKVNAPSHLKLETKIGEPNEQQPAECFAENAKPPIVLVSSHLENLSEPQKLELITTCANGNGVEGLLAGCSGLVDIETAANFIRELDLKVKDGASVEISGFQCSIPLQDCSAQPICTIKYDATCPGPVFSYSKCEFSIDQQCITGEKAKCMDDDSCAPKNIKCCTTDGDCEPRTDTYGVWQYE